MNYNEMDLKLKSILKEKRYRHSIGVMQTAVHLAEIYGADVEKARIAGLLHDAAKNLDKAQIFDECEKLGVKLDEIEKNNTALIHAVLGQAFIQREFGIDDEEILLAVRYHTTGRANMSLLEKIIYIADMIEPNRKFDGVMKLRSIVERDLDKACIMGLTQTIEFTLEKGKLIHPNTIYARNWLILESC